MTEVEIKLYDPERGTTFDLMDVDTGETLSTGDTCQIDEGVELTKGTQYIQKGVGGGEFVQFTLEIVRDLGVSVAGAYLYEKLKDRDIGSFEIGGKETEVEEEEIKSRLFEFT